eukprot:CAMPEP_0184650888 /NCGR_PEP_ID=MMETSP0308-20130426/8460_1 /TAXON_ID=38269 /ORGANISM="Gloeochaete witrockiana, Strain SAG 46.84" /LENGTH=403 /DNA_ID=CAMNT_0027084735 /DNA_START=366 /DNA_END=1577 /DNA_ORIENTATION=+
MPFQNMLLLHTRFFFAYRDGKPWRHEDMSAKLFRHLIDQNHLDDQFFNEERNRALVCDLITCTEPRDAKNRDAFLFDIIANYRNSIDADKFDYIPRDCYTLNWGYNDRIPERLMMNSRVIENTICFKTKVSYDCYAFFGQRLDLHQQVYTHAVVKAADLMIGDVFCYANDVFRIKENAEDPETFSLLNDTLLNEIERSTTDDNNLRKAQDIIKRLRKRDLYQSCGDILLQTTKENLFENANEEIIAKYAPSSADLRASHFSLQTTVFDYAMKDKNPIDFVRFYNSDTDLSPHSVPKSSVSNFAPEVFKEKKLRVFCKERGKEEALKAAFQKYCEAVDSGRKDSPITLISAAPTYSPTPRGITKVVSSATTTPRSHKKLDFDSAATKDASKPDGDEPDRKRLRM